MSKISQLYSVAMATGLAACVSDNAQQEESPIKPEIVEQKMPEAPESTEIDSTIVTVKRDLHWANEGGYIAFASDGEYVAAVKDLYLNIDVTREIRGTDPSLAESNIHVIDYDPGADKLLVGDGKNLWVVTGLFDVVEELPNAKVTGKKVK